MFGKPFFFFYLFLSKRRKANSFLHITKQLIVLTFLSQKILNSFNLYIISILMYQLIFPLSSQNSLPNPATLINWTEYAGFARELLMF